MRATPGTAYTTCETAFASSADLRSNNGNERCRETAQLRGLNCCKPRAENLLQSEGNNQTFFITRNTYKLRLRVV